MPLSREISEVVQRIVKQRELVRKLAEGSPKMAEARHQLEQLESYLEVLMLRRRGALDAFNQSRRPKTPPTK